jgi:SpoVK/Ycf46/Vps4 family AAA+-type ATPase
MPDLDPEVSDLNRFQSALEPQAHLVSELDLMIRARYPVVYLVSPEEEPAEELLVRVAERTEPARQLYIWDLVKGWEDTGEDRGSVMGALGRVARAATEEDAIFILRDLHFVLRQAGSEKNAPIIRELKNLSRALKRSRKLLVLLSHTLEIPADLAEDITVMDMPLPSSPEISRLIDLYIAPDKLKLGSALGREQLVKACQGLSRERIRRVLARALAAKQCVTETDIDLVLEEKKQAIRQTGILEFFRSRESLKSVGGLDNLKQWVRVRQEAFTEEARRYGLPNPKGILLVGIQGTGKSLSAKTIAHEWRLPLLRLDAGRLFGGIVGESESRVRQMIQLSEAMAPCVLWIDEIDKAFGNITSGADGDSGTSRRVFGSLITWMQEKTSPVFIVATANNVPLLPPELMRKGRFDEIFFLNLPTEPERKEIFRVHVQRIRPNRVREFDFDALAQKAINFSGAEIEQVIIDAMHQAFGGAGSGSRRDFETQDILQAISDTVPLATIARDQIEALKCWAAQAGARTASQDAVVLDEMRQCLLPVQGS